MFDICSQRSGCRQSSEARKPDRYVKSSTRSFYPLVSLNSLDDGASEVKMSDLNFVERDRGSNARGREPNDRSDSAFTSRASSTQAAWGQIIFTLTPTTSSANTRITNSWPATEYPQYLIAWRVI